MADVSKAPAPAGVVISTADADRINIGLEQTAGILELVRFTVEAQEFGRAALAMLRARGDRMDVVYPEPVTAQSIACALYAAGGEVERARDIVNGASKEKR